MAFSALVAMVALVHVMVTSSEAASVRARNQEEHMEVVQLWLKQALAAKSAAAAPTEDEAREWLVYYNAEASKQWNRNGEAWWTYNTNITEYNEQRALAESSATATFDELAAQNASLWDWENFQDELTKREFSKITDIGTAILPDDDYNAMSQVQADMEQIYNTAVVCGRPGYDPSLCYPLDPDITNIMANSRNWYELLWAWQGWRDESGKKMPDMYQQFVGYLNQAAVLNGYPSNKDYWLHFYETPGFDAECERLWQEVKPLYEQLHAYVRKKLKQFYVGRESDFPQVGHIPAHILGNMWAQSWMNIESIVRPYPNKTSIDVTDEMIRQGYNTTVIFELAEDFFVSLGLPGMPDPFWEKSMLDKPTDGRSVVCHASAWDFYNGIDFRVKQCTEVTHDWLLTTHHEMGHIEYYLEYTTQPVRFRDGANPGFHEAIGDVVSLSVNTPEHLASIGLLPNYVDDAEVDINFLMTMALDKLAFIPFGYMIDQWRWNVFSDVTTRDVYNRDWVELVCKYQGVSPPTIRHANTDFDPGAKYHVPANTEYLRYFVSHILQFHFHQSLCQAANYTGPLHRCDIYNSKAAGQMLGDMLKMGSSRPWPDALEAITGVRNMTALPIIEYFRPLMDWLTVENEGETIGWTEACPAGIVIGGPN